MVDDIQHILEFAHIGRGRSAGEILELLIHLNSVVFVGFEGFGLGFESFSFLSRL